MPSFSISKTKMQRIPRTHKVHKRPVLRPAIPSPYMNSSSPKVLYIRPATKWVAVIKRTEKLLALVAKREQGLHGATNDEILAVGCTGGSKLAAFRAARRKSITTADTPSRSEEVHLKGTGKAIRRVLEIGLWFQNQPNYRVTVTTGTTGVIDDIVDYESETNDRAGKDDIHKVAQSEGRQSDTEVPETRIRMLSTITVAVGLR